MSTSLQELIQNNGDIVVRTTVTSTSLVVEPNDGPTKVEDLMDRFPDTIYQQGRDTHLFRFLQALCGDSGAGLLQKQSYDARLRYETEQLQFQDLDEFYVSHFAFKRLKHEIYDFNPRTERLTPTDWDEVHEKDESYRQRIYAFMQATRHGPNPKGMALAAQAGCGLLSDIHEQYRQVFDRFSDDPIYIGKYRNGWTGGQNDFVAPMGKTISVSEFVVAPHLSEDGEMDTKFSYANSYNKQPIIDNPVKDPATTAIRPVKYTSDRGITVYTIPEPTFFLRPEIEHNMLTIMDRLRPVHTIMSVKGTPYRYLTLKVDPEPFATSERMIVNRYVRGLPEVPWPEVNAEMGWFIRPDIENESVQLPGEARWLPVIFLTPAGIRAYSENARLDPTFDTGAFFRLQNGITPFDQYRSEHSGSFNQPTSQIYTTFQSIPSTLTFDATKAMANNDTQPIMEGSV